MSAFQTFLQINNKRPFTTSLGGPSEEPAVFDRWGELVCVCPNDDGRLAIWITQLLNEHVWKP